MNQNKAEILILSYPNFSSDDYDKIQTVRNRLDPELAAAFPPHFTHLLPLDESWQRTIQNSAEQTSKKFEPISFTIKTVTILDDPSTGENFLVLVPSDPSHMIELHLELYNSMALPAPYGGAWQPHITLGVSTDREMLITEAKQLKREMAGIEGRFDTLELISWQADELTPISSLPLGSK